MEQSPEQFSDQAPEEISRNPEDRLTVREKVQSEIREELYKELSPKQQEILKKAQLVLEEDKKTNTVRIFGKVEIEGESHGIFILRTYEGEVEKILAKIDNGSILSGENAKKLFDFYLPITRLLNEVEHYPTERSGAKETRLLMEKLLGE
jgi:hypothetical protein